MLAGFLEAARPTFLDGTTLTCCTAQDADSQRRRFPEIEWLPYDEATRAACIRRADVWLGLGDTPFQATGGHTWFLDHLCQEAAWCRRADVPMYYLGVGVNEREVVNFPQMRVLIDQAERIWMRDADSVEMLDPLTRPNQATGHGDLAHLALETMRFPPPEPDTLGLVLNFEDPSQYRVNQLASLLAQADGWRLRWLAQEVRALPGSETRLHASLPSGARIRAPLWKPDYAGDRSPRALLAGWEGLDALFVSRYHASLVGAWMGTKVVVFARSDKVVGAARQLGLATVASVGDTSSILQNLREAIPVERRCLMDLAARAREACRSFFDLVDTSRVKKVLPSNTVDFSGCPAETRVLAPKVPMSDQSPRRLLFLHPDAYGDLFLFEPIPRLLRHAWPQTEIAVLIRESYADAVPLLASEGVQFLTTTCNPYREAPGANPTALSALRDTVCVFAPDCVVAACTEQTWLEAAVGAFLPGVRQISFGSRLIDPLARAALEEVVPVDWSAIYPKRVPVEPAEREWEKNLRLAGALLGSEAPRWWPVAHVPAESADQAAGILAEAGLSREKFVVCAAAGTANVPIKHWSAQSYAETVAWLEHERGLRAMLIGHVSEREHLETVRDAARQAGANPALWLGKDGEMPVVAGLLEAGRFYFGNDTGALHLAAALGKPVVSVFGGGTWPRFQPVARRSMTIVQPLPCFGCAWDCFYVDAPCVRTISPASVRRALEQFLQDDADGQTVFQVEDLDPAARALIAAATPRLRFQREDSVARLRQATELTELLRISEADRNARLGQVEQLTDQLEGSEADRDARQVQIVELTRLLKASEADRDARGRQVTELLPLLKVSEADRDARGRQVTELLPLLKVSEADRSSRQAQVQELAELLKVSELDRNARQVQIEELTELLKVSELDRADRGEQVIGLTTLLRTSETDRDARYVQIQQLTAWLKEREAEQATLHQRLEQLSAQVNFCEAEQDHPRELLGRRATPETIFPVDLAQPDTNEPLTAKLIPPPPSGTP